MVNPSESCDDSKLESKDSAVGTGSSVAGPEKYSKIGNRSKSNGRHFMLSLGAQPPTSPAQLVASPASAHRSLAAIPIIRTRNRGKSLAVGLRLELFFALFCF